MKHFPHWAPQALRFRWHRWRGHARILRQRGPAYYLRWNYAKVEALIRTWLNSSAYRWVSESEARSRRKSDKVFIFGSGYSLNDLGPEEWMHFARHDVFGFSGFVHQRWLPVDFHLIRNWDDEHMSLDRRMATAREYVRTMSASGCFEKTLFIVQHDPWAVFTHTLLGWALLPRRAAVLGYRTAKRVDELPSRSLRAGVTHGAGTLSDTVNVAYLLGWREIVLVGVDLYDTRYFWGPADATLDFDVAGQMVPVDRGVIHGLRWDERHATVGHGIIEVQGAWGQLFAREGVVLSVYNPRSLLAGVLPVYGATCD